MNTQNINTDSNLIDNPADIELNKPSKSRFLFLLGLFGFLIFANAGCLCLHDHGFKPNVDTVAPGNTLYNPTYK